MAHLEGGLPHRSLLDGGLDPLDRTGEGEAALAVDREVAGGQTLGLQGEGADRLDAVDGSGLPGAGGQGAEGGEGQGGRSEREKCFGHRVQPLFRRRAPRRFVRLYVLGPHP